MPRNVPSSAISAVDETRARLPPALGVLPRMGQENVEIAEAEPWVPLIPAAGAPRTSGEQAGPAAMAMVVTAEAPFRKTRPRRRRGLARRFNVAEVGQMVQPYRHT